jgi:hypothetical protein
MILTLCNCLETSNSLLNTFHSDTEPGEKKDLILKCINNNSKAIIAGLEYGQAAEQVFEGIEEQAKYLGQYFAVPVEDHTEAIKLLREVRDHSFSESEMYKAIANAIILLTGEDNE